MPATALQLRRGTTAQHATFTGLPGEVTVDTTKKALVVHDGATAGGSSQPTPADLAAVNAAITAINAAITALAPSLLPPGIGGLFYRTTPPPGWLKANGTAVAVATYTALAASIYCGDAANATAVWGYRTTSTSAPAANRSTTGAYIVLPDGRGEFSRGWDDSRGVDPGRSLWSQQADAFRAHNHGTGGNEVFGTAGTFSYYQGQNRATNISETVGDVETRPRNIAQLACIKY